MTEEEAINILNRDDDSMRKGYFCINDFKAIEVLKSKKPKLTVDAITELQEEVSEQEKWLSDAGYNAYNIDMAFKSIIRAIQALPTVTPTRKVGKWIRKPIRNDKGGCIGAEMICSCCNKDNKHDEYMDYCPNCGAKMEGDEE